MADTKSTAPEVKGEYIDPVEAVNVGWTGIRRNDHPDEAFAATSGPDSPVQRADGSPVPEDELKANSEVDKANTGTSRAKQAQD